ncbi:MerR family transcriptional regulator [Aureimonas jatrophae]|uniref:DNA-binding transcriptional regulator, MerR family n=1 Tax=Aureimonas jatrophae TaxID=1166073 RepID=A0A1H0IQP5_9HYPH|nr:MerR family transcriptional regulator [Aureimonas jatrophae]MBB3952312.1 DNA-binding transcriptional MerR regulator [Aureimonas jatrophae]SDO33799.1 DNA-binding transcriptional regulator, MerR family [Aureimonas jatrophae]
MNIGEAARRSGLPPKTIRYYEEVGLLAPARAANGYRDYAERDVHILRFLQRLRSLGFTTDEARRLLALYGPSSCNVETTRHVHRRLAEIDGKIEQLLSLKRALAALASRKADEPAPDCPMLEDASDVTIRMARPA